MRTQEKVSSGSSWGNIAGRIHAAIGAQPDPAGRDLGVSPRRINEIVHGKRSITADTALRLSRYFGTSAEFWLGLQADYDLDTASDRLADRIRPGSEGFFSNCIDMRL